MKPPFRSVLVAVPLAVFVLSGPASAHPRCDADRDGYRHQSRVACYKSCKPLRVRAFCNSWCDRHCRR